MKNINFDFENPCINDDIYIKNEDHIDEIDSIDSENNSNMEFLEVEDPNCIFDIYCQQNSLSSNNYLRENTDIHFINESDSANKINELDNNSQTTSFSKIEDIVYDKIYEENNDVYVFDFKILDSDEESSSNSEINNEEFELEFIKVKEQIQSEKIEIKDSELIIIDKEEEKFYENNDFPLLMLNEPDQEDFIIFNDNTVIEKFINIHNEKYLSEDKPLQPFLLDPVLKINKNKIILEQEHIDNNDIYNYIMETPKILLKPIEIESIYDNWQFTRVNKEKEKGSENIDFDWKQYINNYPDLFQNGMNTKEKAWKHWISYGKNEGRTYFSLNENNLQSIQIIDNFDWENYISNNPDLQDSGIDTFDKAWDHWLNYGKSEGRSFFQIRKDNYKLQKYKQNKDLNKNSIFFDWEQYLINYPDLYNSGIDTFDKAWDHWNKHGKNEGRLFMSKEKNLKKEFDWEQYVENYQDLQDTGINSFDKAWDHWIKHGKNEGRIFINKEMDEFNWKQYIENYQDLQDTGIDSFDKAWDHWIKHGKDEGRIFKSKEMDEFDWKQYIENYQDLQNSGLDTFDKAWDHWIKHGKEEGREFTNFYKEEIENEYNNQIDLIEYNNNNIKFKQKYDRYGTHFFGWKGVINNFVKWFCDNNSNVCFKYNLFFDEWIEKLLVWGNKIINEKHLKEIITNNNKIITFIHNPPFLQLNDKNYKNKISSEVIINDTIQFNSHLFDELEKKGLIDNIVYLYVLSNYHKEYIYYNYPKLQNKLVSVHHPIDLQTNESNYFNIEEFLNNKKIYNIGWWLRNFKTFIDLETPKNYKKYILVKKDFLIPFKNNIVKNNDMSSINIINEVSTEEYSKIFKNTCIFADIVDCIANNTILECIKFNTPIIVRRSKSAEEYLGVNYPLFFTDNEELIFLKEESFLLDLIFEAHYYLKNLNKTNIELNTFNKKINYDLHKLKVNNKKTHSDSDPDPDSYSDSYSDSDSNSKSDSDSNSKSDSDSDSNSNSNSNSDSDSYSKSNIECRLTWCCFIDNDINKEVEVKIEQLINNYITQENRNKIKLLFFIKNKEFQQYRLDNSELLIIINNYIELYKNIDFIFLDDEFTLNKQLYFSVKYSTTPYITIVVLNDIYHNSFSNIGITKLDTSYNCDITFTSYYVMYNNENRIEQIYPKDMLLNKYFVNKNIIDNRGIIWRKDLYLMIEQEEKLDNILEDMTYNNYNFWLKCVENNLNMICISEIPLFTKFV